ncbi:MAG: hypothetical protein KDD61_13285 [Bdellovibrionales bacterium]|nr:hypothetical protein [Bdellovibrionales bacterium]
MSVRLNRFLAKVSKGLDSFIFIGSFVVFISWFTSNGFLYSPSSPVMSPFTAFSLLLMSGSRLAEKVFDTWSKPMTLALLGIVACGNFSSMWIQWNIPELFFHSLNGVVPTSSFTSIGLILFCFYEILVIVRKTPDSAIIVDDILLHLALFPGGLSFLGHVLQVPAYMSSAHDPRVGIGYLEMTFMGAFAVGAVISNPNLFLWRFLGHSTINRLTFTILFINQYVAPILIGWLLQSPTGPIPYGIEFFVMLAGVLATLIFLVINALCKRCLEQQKVSVSSFESDVS